MSETLVVWSEVVDIRSSIAAVLVTIRVLRGFADTMPNTTHTGGDSAQAT